MQKLYLQILITFKITRVARGKGDYKNGHKNDPERLFSMLVEILLATVPATQQRPILNKVTTVKLLCKFTVADTFQGLILHVLD